MLKTILIALDSPDRLGGLVELGIRWARPTDAMLVGLGIINEPEIVKPLSTPIGADSYKKHRDESLLTEARHKAEQCLAQFALRCAQSQISAKLLEDVGLPAEQITLESQRYDLVMIGDQAQPLPAISGRANMLRDLLINCPRPVVVVPATLTPDDAILIAYDGSLQAARMLQALVALELPQRASAVHLLSCDSNHLEAARRADRGAEYLRFHGIEPTIHIADEGDGIGVQIVAHVAALRAGMLAMGCYGQSTFRDFVFGSVTRHVLERPAVPVFLYH